MTLDQLEAVIAIVEAGSFRAAAEKLNRSQPALSASVKNLEDEFDLQIFDRKAYRPKLTEAGAAFVQAAQLTLSSSQFTARVARELGTKKGETKLRVSVDPLVAIESIEILAHECSRPTYPVTLILEKSILNSSEERLLSGKIDLALGPCAQANDKIETLLLESVTMVGAISRKLLQEKRKGTKEVLESNAQIFAYDLNQNEEPDQLIKAVRKGTHQKIFVPDHATKVKLIASGLGWGRVSSKELKETEGLIAIEKAVLAPVTLDLCLMRSKSRPLGPIARAIWKVFEKLKKS